MYSQFKGVGVALVTPFDKNLEVSLNGLDKLYEYINPGVDYWVLCGTTGESATLMVKEEVAILEHFKKINKDKKPIVYGMGSNDTREVLRQLDQFDLSNVDAILSISPYYNKPTQEGLIHHYSIIADASPVPVILYNVPGRTSSNISADTTLKLAEHPNIIGIKEASGDIYQVAKIAKYKPKDFLLISGEDLMTSSMIAFGCEGVISVLANGFPNEFRAYIHSALKGDFETSKEYLFYFLDINPHMYSESNPVGVKAVLSHKGIIDSYVRPPLMQPSMMIKDAVMDFCKKEKPDY